MPTQSTLLHARSRYHEWQGVGPLSLKSFYGGEAHYTVAGGRYRVDNACYLLLNAGQEYAITECLGSRRHNIAVQKGDFEEATTTLWVYN